MATISARELERVVPPAVQLKRRWGSLLKHAVLIALSIAFVFPLYWLITTSLKPSSQVMRWPPVWFPHPLVWNWYPQAMNFEPFGVFVKNTLTAVNCAPGIKPASSLPSSGGVAISSAPHRTNVGHLTRVAIGRKSASTAVRNVK